MSKTPDATLVEQMDVMRSRVEAALEEILRTEDPRESRLVDAMRYSVMGDGKRIRPILCLASYEAVGGRGNEALPVAAALELIHAYSLVHDDLPCMDDDDTRRGKPAVHKAYGEGMAVLVGDGLLTLAFEVLATAPEGSSLPPARKMQVLKNIARAAGIRGMIAGQVGDLEALECPGDASLIDYVHARKTGALIAVSVWSGARLGTDEPGMIARLGQYGENVGLAFQIVDDILDYTDRPDEAASYVVCHGLVRARERAEELISTAKAGLDPLGENGRLLRDIADFILAQA
ncbi:MAG: polyprenyl synthetase family protein [Candidatus Eisenbacteria sp.]|nr:polyprenyl synthetase family protein [Candidatus Eisenbacteria bacterium]